MLSSGRHGRFGGFVVVVEADISSPCRHHHFEGSVVILEAAVPFLRWRCRRPSGYVVLRSAPGSLS
jgi:hypothetical protein